MVVAYCKCTSIVDNHLVFHFYCCLDNIKPLQGPLKTMALKTARITAARLTCSDREHVLCEHAASPSKSNVVGSTNTCKTFAAGNALSGDASALQHCCSTYCTHCTSADDEPS